MMSLLETIHSGKRQQAPRLLIYGSEGIGKAQPLDAQILTPNGFVPMGTIQVGDEIIGSDGRSCRVIGVYPQGEKEVYRVTFRDGSSTRCCREHLWFTQTRTERDHGIRGAVRSLDDIQKNLRYGTHFNHQVPRVAPIHFKPGDDILPLNPWLLGMYLGDGHCSGSVTVTNCETDLRMKIEATLPANDACSESDSRFVGKGLRIRREQRNNDTSDTKAALESMGLIDCRSEDKFIPPQYLYASIEDRLELLRGLLDSDGFVTNPGAVEYCTVSPQLARDVVFLIRSLGGSATTTEKHPTYTCRGEKRQGQKAYRIFASFPPDIVPVSSAKHLEKWQVAEWIMRHTIRSIEADGVALCQCIRVDAPDSLYVTDDFLLTHNSTLAANAPKPIFVATEDGLDQIACDSFPLAKTFSEAMNYFHILANEKHDYQTVVLDSGDWYERLVWDQVCKDFGVKHIEKADGGFHKGYNHALTYWRQLIDVLRRLREEKGMISIILAHAKIETFTDPESSAFDRFSPRLHKFAAAYLCEWCDAILLATREFSAAKGDKSGGGRILRCTPSAVGIAKNRYGFPDVLPLDWNAIYQAMIGGTRDNT